MVGKEGDILAVLPLCACDGLGSNWQTGQSRWWNVVGAFPRRTSLVKAIGLDHVRLGAFKAPTTVYPVRTPCCPYCSEQTGQPVGTSQPLTTRHVYWYLLLKGQCTTQFIFFVGPPAKDLKLNHTDKLPNRRLDLK